MGNFPKLWEKYSQEFFDKIDDFDDIFNNILANTETFSGDLWINRWFGEIWHFRKFSKISRETFSDDLWTYRWFGEYNFFYFQKSRQKHLWIKLWFETFLYDLWKYRWFGEYNFFANFKNSRQKHLWIKWWFWEYLSSFFLKILGNFPKLWEKYLFSGVLW